MGVNSNCFIFVTSHYHDEFQDNARVLAKFYGSEKVDVFENHRTVVPSELGNVDIIYV